MENSKKQSSIILKIINLFHSNPQLEQLLVTTNTEGTRRVIEVGKYLTFNDRKGVFRVEQTQFDCEYDGCGFARFLATRAKKPYSEKPLRLEKGKSMITWETYSPLRN